MHTLAATAVGRGHVLAVANLDLALVAGSGLCTATKSLLDLLGHSLESVLDVGGLLGRGLNEGNTHAVSKLLGDSGVDNLLVGHIALVTNKQLVDALGSVAVNLLEPLLDVVEGFLLGGVVDNNDTVGTTVVRRGDGAETLLSSCVPLEIKLVRIQTKNRGN